MRARSQLFEHQRLVFQYVELTWPAASILLLLLYSLSLFILFFAADTCTIVHLSRFFVAADSWYLCFLSYSCSTQLLLFTLLLCYFAALLLKLCYFAGRIRVLVVEMNILVLILNRKKKCLFNIQWILFMPLVVAFCFRWLAVELFTLDRRFKTIWMRGKCDFKRRLDPLWHFSGSN